jgi:2'-5' RNA ligase
MVRTFIAIELSEDIRSRIVDAQEPLRGPGSRLTFVAPPAAHITIKFLGDVDEETIPGVIEAIRSIRGTPFDITITGIGCNSRAKPRVIWGIVRDRGECADLARQVDEALAPLGFAKETRPFRPHVTLARVRECDARLVQRVQQVADTALGSVRVTALKLKKSTLTPKGPVYEDLAEVPL